MIEQALRSRRPLPPKIENAPSLHLGNEIYYDGFLDLTSCRQVGFAVGPIPMNAILEYCRLTEISGELQEDFLWIIPRLDRLYLDWSYNRASPHTSGK